MKLDFHEPTNNKHMTDTQPTNLRSTMEKTQYVPINQLCPIKTEQP